VRIDLRKGEANILISDEEYQARLKALIDKGGFPIPASQTPWQEIQRAQIGQAATGAVLESAIKYQKIAQTIGVPRHNH
jgi:dihydroxy-acid dehydratase